MYLKRAINAYQATASATTPVLDTMIEVLNEMGDVLRVAQTGIPPAEIADSLRNLQYALFELMAVVDRGTEEGERLFLLYISLNQTLVTVQLYKRYELLPGIEAHVSMLAESWEDVRRNQRLQRYAGGKI